MIPERFIPRKLQRPLHLRPVAVPHDPPDLLRRHMREAESAKRQVRRIRQRPDRVEQRPVQIQK